MGNEAIVHDAAPRIQTKKRKGGSTAQSWGFVIYAPDGDESADAMGTRRYATEQEAREAGEKLTQQGRMTSVIQRYEKIIGEQDAARSYLVDQVAIADRGRVKAVRERDRWRSRAWAMALTALAVAATAGALVVRG